MAIKVFWTDFAKKQLKDIFEFYKIKANKEIAEKLVSGIVIKTKTIEFQKDIGQIEEFLLLRKEKFRYLVYKNYKIIYWFNAQKNRIEISDIFDVRQNPVNLMNDQRNKK